MRSKIVAPPCQNEAVLIVAMKEQEQDCPLAWRAALIAGPHCGTRNRFHSRLRRDSVKLRQIKGLTYFLQEWIHEFTAFKRTSKR